MKGARLRVLPSASRNRHGAGEDVKAVPLGDFHQCGDEFLRAIHHIGEFGGDVWGF